MKKQLFILMLVCLGFFLVFGCLGSNSGSDDDGDKTETDQGLTAIEVESAEPGAAGAAGINCWDLNEDGVGDIDTEDQNEDGIVNVLDCSVVCWDLDGDGSKDTEEDINEDGVINVYDCTPEESDCLDEDADGFCDVIGSETFSKVCLENDPGCINGCEGGTIQTGKSCEKECERMYEGTEDTLLPECGDYVDDSTDPPTLVKAEPSCEETCKEECTPFTLAKEECPEGFIIPSYYESKKISVNQCSVYHDVLVITDHYMKFESFSPQTIPSKWSECGTTMSSPFSCRRTKNFNDNFEVGFSMLCEKHFPNHVQKAIVKINGIPHKWTYPSVDYFEFIDKDIDRSEPMFVLPLQFSECLAQNIIKVPKMAYNHHRRGQLTFMFHFINVYEDYDFFFQSFDKYPCLSETGFRIFYKKYDPSAYVVELPNPDPSETE